MAKFSVGGFLALSLLSVSCGRALESTSSPKTVHINQTSVKDQGSIGFCWSYTTMGLIESMALRDGKSVDLSEEYVGFYRILKGLTEALRSEKPEAGLKDFSEGYQVHKALTLVDEVGLVPEKVFTKKFTGAPGFVANLAKSFLQTIKDPAKLEQFKKDPGTIRSALEAAFGRKIPTPDSSFVYEGKTYTPRTFARDYLHFKSDDYMTLLVADGDSESQVMAYHFLKVALMNHISVPVGMSVLEGVSGPGAWDANLCSATGCESISGHAMLAVDFVTRGGKGGEIPRADALRLFFEPLEAIIVKNSWGKVTGLNQEGITADDASGTTGFTTIERSFLEESVKSMPLSVTVPKFVFEQKNGVVEAGTRGGIRGPTSIAIPGEDLSFNGVLMGIPAGVKPEAASMSWSLAPAGAANSSVAASGQVFSVKTDAPGRYQVTLTTTAGGTSHTARRQFWVGQEVDLLSFPSVWSAQNFAFARTDSVGRLQLGFDTRDKQAAADANSATVDLPAVTMQEGGRIEILVNTDKDKRELNPSVEASFEGGPFAPLPCSKVDGTESESPRRSCPYPAGQTGSDRAGTLRLRLVAHQTPLADSKVVSLLNITELSARFAGAQLESNAELIPVSAEYPQGSLSKKLVLSGKETSLQGLFSTNITSVRIYRGGSLLREIPLSELSHVDGKLLASTSVTASGTEVSSYRLVAVVAGGREASSLDYRVMSIPSLKVTKAAPVAFDFGVPPTIAVDGWLQIPKAGLSASPLTADKKALRRIENNLSATVAFAVDLSASSNTVFALSAFHVLEEKFDFLRVRVSIDGGRTFEEIMSVNGMSIDKKTNQLAPQIYAANLSRFDGMKEVILRVDVETDAGFRSNLLVLKELAVVAR